MKKSFGQHLLTDRNYLQKIINAVSLKPDDTVLEIGAGSGLLTSCLAKSVKKVYAIEIERSILKKLKENLKNQNIKNVEVIEEDFLKLNISGFTSSPFHVIGNIPYNITSKILIKLFGEIDKPSEYLNLMTKAYLMLQYEVAQRVIGKPNTKNYSPLSILIQYFTIPKILFKVPQGAFVPPPNVDSAFVAFNIKEKLEIIENPAFFKKVVRIGFQQRRKKLINSLNSLIEDKSKLISTFGDLKLNQNLRAENLNFEQYLKLANYLNVCNKL